MRHLKLRLALPVLATAMLLAGCEKAAAPTPERPRPVRSITLGVQQASVVLALPAEVRPRVETRYGFRVGGKIASRAVSAGDRVAPGQTLAKLDPRDRAPALHAAQSQLDAAQTEARLARIELDRQLDLRARNYVSQAQVDRQRAASDAAQARVRTALAQREQAGNDVSFQTLRADVDGVVTVVEAEAGQVVAAGQTVVRVAQGDDYELLVHVSERDLGLARAAPVWQARIPALGESTFPAVLRELSPLADPASRTYAMRLALRSPTPGIALGMTAVVQATHETRPAYEVPLSALHSRDGRPRVWRIGTDDRVELVEVETAGFLDDSVRVVGGLASGDRVVTAGANVLVAGQRVRVVEAPQPADPERSP